MRSLKWKFIVGLIIAALFLAYFFKRADIGSILEKAREANPLYLLIALFFVYLSYLIRSWRWVVLLRPMGTVSLWSSFKITTIGFMFNNLIPRTGEIARPVLIGKKEGMSISSALATVFIERVLDFLCLFTFFAFFSIVSSFTIVNDPGLNKMGWFLGLITLCLILFMCFLKWKKEQSLRLAEICLKPFPEKFGKKIRDILKLFIAGLDIIGSGKSILFLIVLSFLMWISIVALTESVILSFGPSLHTQPVMIQTYFFIATIGVVFCAIAMMVPTPGGTGSFHVMLSAALAMMGEEKVLSNSIAALTHAVTYVPITITGLIFLYLEGMNLTRLGKTVEEAETADKTGT